jgi:hypothetical protein
MRKKTANMDFRLKKKKKTKIFIVNFILPFEL